MVPLGQLVDSPDGPTPAPAGSRHDPPKPRDYSVWVALGVVLLMAGLLRYRLLPIPLERDEGEYAYAGQLLLQGQPPYVHVYNMKMPGIYVCYALILATLGQTHVAIHVGLLLVNAVAIVLVFLLGRRLLGDWPAVAAAAVFAIFSLHSDVQGVFANAEHFVLVPALAGFVVLLGKRRIWNLVPARRDGIWDLKNGGSGVPAVPAVLAVPSEAIPGGRWRIFWAGVLLGLGFIIKQHAAAFVAWGGLYVVGVEIFATPRRWRLALEQGLLFSAGAVAPLALTGLAFVIVSRVFQVDALGQFWFWTFTYAGQYVSQMTLAQGWFNLSYFGPYHLVRSTLPLTGLGILGLAALRWDPAVRRAGVFLGGLLVFSFIAITPGLYFRPHYFVLTLPAVALWGGAALHGVANLAPRWNIPRALRLGAPLVLVLAAMSYTVVKSRIYLFEMNLDLLAHQIYEFDPFPEALVIADYIRKNTTPDEKVLILGSEPEILFYAHRHSATGYIYMYPLMEVQPYAAAMQAQMISEALASKPAVVVYAHVPNSWDFRPNSFPLVMAWKAQYKLDYFRCVGIVDIWSNNAPAIYTWGEDLMQEPRASYSWLKIYRPRDKPLDGK